MIRYPRRLWLLATLVSALAGYVDAIGFLMSDGFFVSFMSGNSTRLGLGVTAMSGSSTSAMLLIGLFLVGVVGGSLVSTWGGSWRKPLVLLLVGLTITAAALCSTHSSWEAASALAIAMGAANTIFLREGEVSVGVTYMTGTIVKFGQRLTVALLGGRRWDWLPYLMLWTGFVVGAIGGSTAYRSLGGLALSFAAAGALLLAALAAILRQSSVPHGR
jgi:uncharacterized membrane protein YoaK (UPF0700 family)